MHIYTHVCVYVYCVYASYCCMRDEEILYIYIYIYRPKRNGQNTSRKFIHTCISLHNIHTHTNATDPPEQMAKNVAKMRIHTCITYIHTYRLD